MFENFTFKYKNNQHVSVKNQNIIYFIACEDITFLLNRTKTLDDFPFARSDRSDLKLLFGKFGNLR